MKKNIPYPNMHNICVIITTYNPDSGFLYRISIISKQVDKIVIIDNNSNIASINMLNNISTNTKIEIIYNNKNKGVATALNQGFLFAKHNNLKWVLIFDQDSFISDTFFEILFQSYQKMPNKAQIGIIGPSYFDEKSRKPKNKEISNDIDNFNEVKFLITSGSLLTIEVYEQIGPFRDDLFIDFVDFEYCLRARSKGFKIIKVNILSMQHSIGSKSIHRLPWKYTYTSNHIPLRRYYMMRNHIIVVKKYLFLDLNWAISSLFARFKSTLLMCFFEKQRMQKLKYTILGLVDGILGKTNRIIKNSSKKL